MYITLQRKLQGKIKPALWLPPVARFHSEEHEWTFSCDAETAATAIWAAAKATKGFEPVKMSPSEVVIDFLTAAKWLDRLTLRFSNSTTEDGGCTCRAHNGSTGVLPLVVPLAPVINMALFFVIFADGGKCGATLNALRRAVESSADVKVSSKVVRYSLTNPKRAAAK